MRILSGFVLCEWDKTDLLRSLPSATWMGDNWRVSPKDREKKELAAWIIRKEKEHIEFGLHGLGHEFWADGKMERTEFHNDACKMREGDEIRRHLVCFFKLMDQYGFDFRVNAFIPPALKHSFGNPGGGFQKILNEFGIQYVTPVFNRLRLYEKPQTPKIAWENKVLLVERGEAELPWKRVAGEPEFRFDRPVMALHWANILHCDPEQNLTVVEKWVKYFREKCARKGVLVARDTEACFTQYIYKTMSRIEKEGKKY